MWTPDPDLLAEASEAWRRHLDAARSASAADRREALRTALEAAGTLALVERGGDVQTDAVSLREPVMELLQGWSFDALGEAAMDVVTAAELLTPGLATPEHDATMRARSALEVRDAIEVALIGAELVLGRALDLDADQQSSLDAFEELVRPVLWRLTPLNAERGAALAWMAPHHRARFWWWRDGLDVASDALVHFQDVASLVASFEGAREAFEAHVEVARALAAVRQSEKQSPHETASVTDAQTAAYVERGEHQPVVEVHARRDPKFARAVATRIADARAKRRTVAIVARIWEARRVVDDECPTLGIADVFDLAAADDAEDSPRVVRLGQLAPIEAEGQLIFTKTAAELRVYCSPGVIRGAALGTTPAVEEAGCWRAVVERPDWPLELRVDGAEGTTIRARLDPGAAG